MDEPAGSSGLGPGRWVLTWWWWQMRKMTAGEGLSMWGQHAVGSEPMLSPPPAVPSAAPCFFWADCPLWGHPNVTSWGSLSPPLTLDSLKSYLTSSRKPPLACSHSLFHQPGPTPGLEWMTMAFASSMQRVLGTSLQKGVQSSEKSLLQIHPHPPANAKITRVQVSRVFVGASTPVAAGMLSGKCDQESQDWGC